MKKGIITLFIILYFSVVNWAQSTNQMSYQAVIRDASDNLVSNQVVGMRISILQGTENGVVVYEETQNPFTNANGLVSVQIGAGASEYSFADISWGDGPFFLKTEVDPKGGVNYTITGTSQLLSVPYSLYSTTAQNVEHETQTLGDVVANMNFANGQIKNVMGPTEPNDAVNKDYVTLRLSAVGDTLFLGDQFVVIPNLSSANVKAPVVITMDPDEITQTSAVVYGNITDNGWDKIMEYGFVYSEEEGFEDTTATKIIITDAMEKGIFSFELDSLASDKMYYYKAFATNSKGISYGEEKMFTTFDVLLSISPESSKISDVIGSGYNITEKYANSFSLKSSVLDYNKMMKDGIIHEDLNQYSGAILSASGQTLSHYQSNMSVYANVHAKYGCFSGEIKTHYQEARTSSSAFSYATVSSKQIKSAFCIDKDIRLDKAKLLQYVKPEFETDVATMSVSDIFAKYGTDVLLGGMWGGRADYNMSVEKTAASDGKQVGAYVEAKYKSMFTEGGGAIDVDAQYKNDFKTETSQWGVYSRGGNGATISSLADMKAWQASITDDNQVFMEFYHGSVLPISELIKDENLKSKIAFARDTFIQNRGIKTYDTPIREMVVHDLGRTGFTALRSGDDDVYSKDGRNTNVSVRITVNKKNSNVLTCSVFLAVKEVHSDNTTYSGSYSFDITTDKELLDFSQKTYSYSNNIEGSHHDFVPLPITGYSWLSDLAVCFDSNSNDQQAIGISGKLNLNLEFRDPFWQ